ncbi:MAG: PqqD family protein [Chloroflexi bacterium]|nr:PqqD family protein [Chloroflexota bacterium]
MEKSNQFRVNTPRVIHEMIDGEVIIVNLEKGHYYSLLGTGAEIWEYVIGGMSTPEIVSRLLTRYEGDRKDIEDAVENMISKLQTEGIIVQDVAGRDADERLAGEVESDGEITKKVFTIPVLEKYTDMEDLLLLDPIHETDETGWPNMALGVPEEEGQIDR